MGLLLHLTHWPQKICVSSYSIGVGFGKLLWTWASGSAGFFVSCANLYPLLLQTSGSAPSIFQMVRRTFIYSRASSRCDLHFLSVGRCWFTQLQPCFLDWFSQGSTVHSAGVSNTSSTWTMLRRTSESLPHKSMVDHGGTICVVTLYLETICILLEDYA